MIPSAAAAALSFLWLAGPAVAPPPPDPADQQLIASAVTHFTEVAEATGRPVSFPACALGQTNVGRITCYGVTRDPENNFARQIAVQLAVVENDGSLTWGPIEFTYWPPATTLVEVQQRAVSLIASAGFEINMELPGPVMNPRCDMPPATTAGTTFICRFEVVTSTGTRTAETRIIINADGGLTAHGVRDV